MRSTLKHAAVVCAIALGPASFDGALVARAADGGSAATTGGQRETPRPVATAQVLLARPFTLEVPFRSDWSAERPQVSSGVLLVISADPDLVRTRETQEPVLFVGERVVERLITPPGSGIVIGFAPGPVDLSVDPIWFATPSLPESIDRELAHAARLAAVEAGVGPLPSDRLAAARRAGGEPLRLRDRVELLEALAVLAQQHR